MARKEITVTLSDGDTQFEHAFWFPIREQPLTQMQWDALEKAEAKLYRGEYGLNGYTHVMPRESSSELVHLWDTAWIGCESADTDWEMHEPPYRNARVAMRVAQAMALINFGAEFLLKSY